jgi:glutathione S-transferase
MKLYDCRTAPSPRRVRIFAAEKGIELEKVEIDLAKGEQFSESFRKINPDCVVPALELDDGTCINEVSAICQYLEKMFPEPALYGSTPVELATVVMWDSKIEQQGLAAMRDAFRNSVNGLKGHALTGPVSYEQIPELAERGRTGVSVFLKSLEQQLDSKEFIAGNFFSIADITALVLVDFAAWIKISIPENATNLKRWYTAVSSRPSTTA